jgi:hypothetical protein
MNDTILNVNQQIINRTDVLSTIKGTEDLIKQDFSKYPLNQYKFSDFLPNFTYDATPIPVQSQDPESVSEYAVLKPINFGS